MQNIQKQMETFFKSSCYAYCIAWVYNNKDIYAMTQNLLEGYRRGYIEANGYVSKPHKFASMCMGIQGYFKDVKKVYKDLDKGIKIIEYKLSKDAKASHFVVCENGKVVFDPAGDSETVKYGIPVSSRIFIA